MQTKQPAYAEPVKQTATPQTVPPQQTAGQTVFADIRPETVAQRKRQAMIGNSPQAIHLKAQIAMMSNSPRMVAQREKMAGWFGDTVQRQETAVAEPNHTGLPDNLKAGVESVSGISMDHVKVHYNSSKPAQLNAAAYAQGTDIHLAPGQERHLPHEAWHVVQQMQGRVLPTMQLAGMGVNHEQSLEREADAMGAKAVLASVKSSAPLTPGDRIQNGPRQLALRTRSDSTHNGPLQLARRIFSRNVPPGPVVQRMQIFRDNALQPHSGAKPEGEWYVYRVKGDVNDTVYVHADDVIAFFTAYGAMEPEMADEEVVETGPASLGERVEHGDGNDDELYSEVDHSPEIHFKNVRNRDQATRTIDPAATPMSQFDIGLLTGEALPGQIEEVIFRAPGTGRTHFEIMCVATGASPGDDPVYIKFDFTMNGYRMLYAADADRSDGLTARDQADVTTQHIMVGDATGMFASRAYANGAYREGANECSNFARNFFKDLTGHDPKE